MIAAASGLLVPGDYRRGRRGGIAAARLTIPEPGRNDGSPPFGFTPIVGRGRPASPPAHLELQLEGTDPLQAQPLVKVPILAMTNRDDIGAVSALHLRVRTVPLPDDGGILLL